MKVQVNERGQRIGQAVKRYSAVPGVHVNVKSVEVTA